MAGPGFNAYTYRQTMIAQDYEIYRYHSTYLNEVELHHHDFYEVYLLLGGRVEYIVENQIYRVRPGDWMLISPLELHQARIATDADAYERIVLWVARPYLERLSTPRTSLTRCFDTSVPGHTNLLRLPAPAAAQMRAAVERLYTLRASKGLRLRPDGPGRAGGVDGGAEPRRAEARRRPPGGQQRPGGGRRFALYQRALQRAADPGPAGRAVLHQQIPPAAQV